jgi:SHS2 domain-containing protein
MKNKFKNLEHKSDVLFIAYGRNAKETIQNAAQAMLDTISKTEKIKPNKKITIRVKSENLENLIIDTLNLVLAKSDAKEIFFKKIKIEKLDVKKAALTATCIGSAQTPILGKTVVKAATFHEFELNKGKKWKVKILLDI